MAGENFTGSIEFLVNSAAALKSLSGSKGTTNWGDWNNLATNIAAISRSVQTLVDVVSKGNSGLGQLPKTAKGLDAMEAKFRSLTSQVGGFTEKLNLAIQSMERLNNTTANSSAAGGASGNPSILSSSSSSNHQEVMRIKEIAYQDTKARNEAKQKAQREIDIQKSPDSAAVTGNIRNQQELARIKEIAYRDNKKATDQKIADIRLQKQIDDAEIKRQKEFNEAQAALSKKNTADKANTTAQQRRSSATQKDWEKDSEISRLLGANKMGVSPETYDVMQKSALAQNTLNRAVKEGWSDDKIRTVGKYTEFIEKQGEAINRLMRYYVSFMVISEGMRMAQNALGEAIKFNDDMIETQKFLPQGSSVAGLKKEAYPLAKEFGVGLADVTGAYADFAKKGLAVNDIMDATRTSLLAMNVASIDYGKATTFLTTATQVWNISMKDSTRLVDQLAYVQARSAVDADRIIEAMQKSAAMAKEVGISSNFLFASIAGITEKTQQSGEMTGTALKTIYERLLRLSNIKKLEAFDFLKDIKFTSGAGEIANAETVLTKIGARWKDLTDVQRKSIGEIVAGGRQINSFIAYMDNFDRVTSLSTQALLSFGYAAKANETEMQKISKQVAVLQDTGLSMTTTFLSPAISLFANMVKVLNGFDSVVGSATKGAEIFLSTIGNTVAWGVIGAYIGKFISSLVLVEGELISLTTAWTSLSVVMSANWVTTLAIAIAAVGAGAYTAYTKWSQGSEDAAAKQKALNEELSITVDKLKEVSKIQGDEAKKEYIAKQLVGLSAEGQEQFSKAGIKLVAGGFNEKDGRRVQSLTFANPTDENIKKAEVFGSFGKIIDDKNTLQQIAQVGKKIGEILGKNATPDFTERLIESLKNLAGQGRLGELIENTIAAKASGGGKKREDIMKEYLSLPNDEAKQKWLFGKPEELNEIFNRLQTVKKLLGENGVKFFDENNQEIASKFLQRIVDTQKNGKGDFAINPGALLGFAAEASGYGEKNAFIKPEEGTSAEIEAKNKQATKDRIDAIKQEIASQTALSEMRNKTPFGKNVIEGLDQVLNAYKRVEAENDKLLKMQSDLSALQEKGSGDPEMATKIKNATDAVAAQKTEIERLKSATNEVESAFIGAGQTWSQRINKAINDSISNVGGLKGAIDRLTGTRYKLAIDIAALIPGPLKALLGLLGVDLSGAAGGGNELFSRTQTALAVGKGTEDIIKTQGDARQARLKLGKKPTDYFGLSQYEAAVQGGKEALGSVAQVGRENLPSPNDSFFTKVDKWIANATIKTQYNKLAAAVMATEKAGSEANAGGGAKDAERRAGLEAEFEIKKKEYDLQQKQKIEGYWENLGSNKYLDKYDREMEKLKAQKKFQEDNLATIKNLSKEQVDRIKTEIKELDAKYKSADKYRELAIKINEYEKFTKGQKVELEKYGLNKSFEAEKNQMAFSGIYNPTLQEESAFRAKQREADISEILFKRQQRLEDLAKLAEADSSISLEKRIAEDDIVKSLDLQIAQQQKLQGLEGDRLALAQRQKAMAGTREIQGMVSSSLNDMFNPFNNKDKTAKADAQKQITALSLQADAAAQGVAAAQTSGNVDAINAAREKLQQVNVQLKEASDRMSEIGDKTNKWKDLLNNIGSSIFKKIIDQLTEVLIKKSGIGEALTGMFSGIEGIGGGGIGSKTGSSGNMFAALAGGEASMFAGLPGMAQSGLSALGGGINAASNGSLSSIFSSLTGGSGGASASGGGGLFGGMGGGIGSYLAPALIGFMAGKSSKSKGAGALTGALGGFLTAGVPGAIIGGLAGLFSGGGDDEPAPAPAREFYPITANSQALDRNTAALMKIGDGVWNSPSVFNMNKLQAESNGPRITTNITINAAPGANTREIASAVNRAVSDAYSQSVNRMSTTGSNWN